MPGSSILEELSELTRRELVSRGLTIAGWGSFALVLGSGTTQTIRFMYPRIVFQPPSKFRIGTPEAFLATEGSADTYGILLVDERWKSRHRFFVVREPSRVYAASGRCPHLGCTVNWFGDQRVFKCPCHGSEFHSNGENFAGPAPRPLDRYWIELNTDGQLVVDTSIVFGPDRFDVDGAFVRL